MTNGVAGDPRESGGLTVGAASALVGVTVRTLHHWHAVGLVRPSERSGAGYRLYSATDIARIHRVLVYRQLGLPLEEIGRLLDDPSTGTRKSLANQRAELLERISQLRGMVRAVDRLIAATDAGILLSPEEQVEIFGSRWQPSWVAEARDRWGDTVQWAQYAERAAGSDAEDWRKVAAGVAAIEHDLAAAKRAGAVPGSPEANALAERHRQAMGAYFDCSHSMQVCLGRMYAADPDFAAHYDAIEPGLTHWLRDIIDANARSRGIDPKTATWS